MSLKKYDDNFGELLFIWLDPQVNKADENRRTQQKLRDINNHFVIFDDQQKCQHYISSRSCSTQVFLIVSGQCGRQLVPQIHHLPQLSCVYVYCMNKQANEEWKKKFVKVRKVIVNRNELIDEIRGHYTKHLRMSEPLIFNTQTHGQSTTEIDGNFVYSLLLIDFLMQMKSIDADKKAFVTHCKDIFRGNKRELDKIDRFNREYSAEKAIWFYSCNSFLHQILNESLRMQDIDLLISLRFVIVDIYQQLKRDKCRSKILVHRFQYMTEEELKKLRRSEGKIISNNSFLSTSMDSSEAMKFCKEQSCPDLERVLFTIDADPRVGTSKPFADISYLAEFHDEREILFMPGCLFRLMKIGYQNTTKGRIVNINMKLCGDSENNLKNLFDHMKKECRISADGNVTPLSFANLLYEMGKYDLAEKMYLRLNQELPSNDPSLLDLYWSFGMLYKATGDYDSSIMWFKRALEIYNQRNLRDYVRIGNLYNWIGESYRSKDENLTALTYFNNAERFFKTENDMNNPSLGHIYNNMGIVHKNLKNYSKALEFYEKSLAIRRKNLPEVHSDIASSYNNRANVYFQLRNYDQAMQYHKMALEMYIKACPAQHPDIGMSHQNIGQIHEKKREWKRAMEHYQKAVAIYRASLESDHPNVIHVQKDIKRVSLILK